MLLQCSWGSYDIVCEGNFEQLIRDDGGSIVAFILTVHLIMKNVRTGFDRFAWKELTSERLIGLFVFIMANKEI